MHDWNNHPQPDQPLNPEDQLDLLLEKFLQDPNDEIPLLEDITEPSAEAPAAAEAIPEEPEIPCASAPEAELSPEAQLDALLASFLAEPLPEDPDAIPEALPELDLDTISLEPTNDALPLPTEIPALYAENTDNENTFDLPPVVALPDLDMDQPAEEEDAPVADTSAEDEPAQQEAEEEDPIQDETEDDSDLPPVVILPDLDMDQPAKEEDAPVADTSAEDEPAQQEAEEEDPIQDEIEDDSDLPPVVILPDLDMDQPAEEEDAPVAETSTEDEPAQQEAEEEDPIQDETEDDSDLPPVVVLPDLDRDEPAEEEDAPVADTSAEDEPAEETEASDAPFILPGFENDDIQQFQSAQEENDEEDQALSQAEELALQQIMAEFLEEEPSEEALEEQPPQPEETPEETPTQQPAEEPQPAPQAIPVELPPEEPDQPEEEPESAAEQPSEAPDEPKKRRPKNTKKYGLLGIPHMLTTLVWLGIIVFIGVGLGKFVWNCAADVLALGKPDSVVVITITDEDDLDDIAQKLKNTGLIRYPSLFKIYGQISEARDSIKSGTFKLNTEFDYHALVDAMSSNQRREQTNVTIPEGYTCAQIFRLLESKGVSTVEKLEAAAANADLGEYWFLEGIERDSAYCLEGFLFPDTYTFYLDHDATGVLQKFLDNFNKRFNDSMKIKLDTLNATLAEMMRANGMSELYISQHQMTVRDVVIIASMIEKETASNPESYNISSVIYNRLTNPENYPYLNIDAALVYVLGHGNLTLEDLQFDSPYNTYLYPGLIPGAISNPGSYSLDAALSPTPSEYYFYALNPFTGEHHFSKTLEEHNAFLESIRKQQEEQQQEEEAQG